MYRGGVLPTRSCECIYRFYTQQKSSSKLNHPQTSHKSCYQYASTVLIVISEPRPPPKNNLINKKCNGAQHMCTYNNPSDDMCENHCHV